MSQDFKGNKRVIALQWGTAATPSPKHSMPIVYPPDTARQFLLKERPLPDNLRDDLGAPTEADAMSESQKPPMGKLLFSLTWKAINWPDNPPQVASTSGRLLLLLPPSRAKSGPYLKMKDNRPDQTQGEFRVPISDVIITNVHQFHLEMGSKRKMRQSQREHSSRDDSIALI